MKYEVSFDRQLELREIHAHLKKQLAKRHHAVLNVIADVSLNEILRGVAALLGRCSLLRLEEEPLGPKSIQVMAGALKLDQPVVLGCHAPQEMPLELFCTYKDVYSFGAAHTVLPRFGFEITNHNGELRDLVFVLKKALDPTPVEFRESVAYKVLGEHEAAALANAGHNDDSAIQPIGTS